MSGKQKTVRTSEQWDKTPGLLGPSIDPPQRLEYLAHRLPNLYRRITKDDRIPAAIAIELGALVHAVAEVVEVLAAQHGVDTAQPKQEATQ